MFDQIVINIISQAASYALIGLSFVVIYRVSHFFNFAHGAVFTSGPYFVFLLCDIIDLPLSISIILAITASTCLGCVLELLFYRKFRKKGSPKLVLLLVSLGIYVLLQNLISLTFGEETRSIRKVGVQEGLKILEARITPIQIVTICVSITLVIVLSIFLKKINIGKKMRAVASDLELASISGINSDAVILWTFGIGSALAGLAGILVALDVDMTPAMGMNALLMGVVVMIIGGVNSISGIAIGALLLAMAQHFCAWFIGSQWQNAIAFIILVLFLLFKPEGFFGKKVKSATV